MKMKFLKIGAVFCIATLIFSGMGTISSDSNANSISYISKVEEFVPGFKSVLKNDFFDLSYNGSTAEIAINDRNGNIWFSNPQDGQNQDYLSKSQMIIYYYKDNLMESMNSYFHCVKDNKHSARVEENALLVEYQIGDDAFDINILPKYVERKRMENEILKKLSEEDREFVLSKYKLYKLSDLDDKVLRDAILIKYPPVALHDVYVRDEVKPYMGKKLYEVFQKASYTLEDLQKDCDDNEIQNTYVPAPNFNITIRYELEKEGVCVKIDPSTIKYTETSPPVRFDLLPYFGSATVNDQGYMFVPDGSGAIINFNNGKTTAAAYEKRLFAFDRAQEQLESTKPQQASTLPVFALSNSDNSFMATIDEGYQIAGITADVGGKSTSQYNHINPYFSLFSSDYTSMSINQAGELKTLTCAPKIFSGNIVINYHLLPEKVEYSELAMKYRQWLIEKGFLVEKEHKTAGFNLEFISTATVSKNFLGFPYKSLSALTTYEQMAQIIDELNLGKPDVRMVNALKGGKQHKIVTKANFEKVLGTQKNRNELLKKTNNLYVSYAAQMASNVSKKQAVKTLSKRLAKQYNYHYVSGRTLNSYATLIRAKLLPKQAEDLAASMRKNNLCAVVTDIGYELNSDFTKNDYFDRKNVEKMVTKYLSTMSENVPIAADIGSVFSFPYLSKIWNIPTDSSNYAIEDFSIPFYAMIVRGLIPYCTEAVNLAGDQNNQFLKAVEIGAELQFSWVYQNLDNVLDYSEFYYNRAYNDTLDIAKKMITGMATIQAEIGQSSLVEHIAHSDTLKESRFANGKIIYVNYGDEVQTIDGVQIEPKSFVCH